MVGTAFLPEELILQIVIRLPVKSVGRCRCVSTRWRSLFSDPEFAKSHLRSSPKHQILILNHTTGLGSLEFDSIEKKPSLLNSPFPAHYCLQFLRSCNGLVASSIFRCIIKERLFIWNPSTGFSTQLPSRCDINEERIDFLSGFGYLSTTDEYKLLMGAEIFSSKKGSWKRIQVPPRYGVGKLCGVFTNGALHWLFYPRVYAFDLEKEEFSMTNLPVAFHTQVGRKYSLSYKLGVTWEGCLYVMLPSLVRDGGEFAYYLVDFWVMREYGNSDSWSRTLGVKIYSEHAVRPNWYISLEAILVSETGAFVRNRAAVKEQLTSTIYHPKDSSSRIYILDNCAQDMVVCEESLMLS